VLILALFFLLFFVVWLIVDHVVPRLWQFTWWVSSSVARRTLKLKRVGAMHARIAPRIDRFSIYLPVVAIIAGGLVLAFVAGDAFADLAEMMHANSPQLRRIDTAVHDAAVYYRDTSSTTFFVAAAMTGSPTGLGVISLAVILAIALRHRYRAIYLAVTIAGGAILNLVLKSMFERQRPDLSAALRHAHGYSFPSGHAMGSTVVFGSLAYLIFRTKWPWRLRSFLMSLSIAAIIAVCASRIYLGVHWTSDIGAGISAGGLWVGATTTAYEVFRRVRRVREQRLAANETSLSAVRDEGA
jgi:undecaprenyl-diphosphatase